jgi:hypothetical protein
LHEAEVGQQLFFGPFIGYEVGGEYVFVWRAKAAQQFSFARPHNDLWSVGGLSLVWGRFTSQKAVLRVRRNVRKDSVRR